ncbi:MAG: hypothetical protein IKM88_06875 [Lachnospiraceae bacterium]|nr:hypothetical protein [Lachnospiraceae bacterium]
MAKICSFCGKKASLGLSFRPFRGGGYCCSNCCAGVQVLFKNFSQWSIDEFQDYLAYRNAYEEQFVSIFRPDLNFGAMLVDPEHGLFALLDSWSYELSPKPYSHQIFEMAAVKSYSINDKVDEEWEDGLFGPSLKRYHTFSLNFEMVRPRIAYNGFQLIYRAQDHQVPTILDIIEKQFARRNPNLLSSNPQTQQRMLQERQQQALQQEMEVRTARDYRMFLGIPENEQLTPALLQNYKNRKISALLNTTNDFSAMDRVEAAAGFLMNYYHLS